jgi:peptide/nickel transport system permease protein
VKAKNTLRAFGRFCKEKPLGAFGIALFTIMIALGLAADALTTFDPITTSVAQMLQGPSAESWFGTDYAGRDVWARFVHGARISMLVSVCGVALATLGGGFLGMLSAYFGGKFDLIVQRLMDIILSFPVLVMGLVVMGVLGPALQNVIITIAIIYSPRINRLSRSAALTVKQLPYIEAARAMGAGSWYIIFKHIFPNCFAHWFVYATALLAGGFLVEAGLSFLGFGVPPPYPSWGRDISSGMDFFHAAPWLAIFPGMGITMAVLGASLLGDALRDVLDPRLKRV